MKAFNHIDSSIAEENPKRYYVVFEELINLQGREKTYDLTHGIFETLEESKRFADSFFDKEPIYVANLADYLDGNYNYLYEVK